MRKGNEIELLVEGIEFPAKGFGFVNIGEETGDLENRLNNLSYLYTQEIKRKSKELTSMAQPVFITIITLAIGITMLTIIMPLLDYELLYKI